MYRVLVVDDDFTVRSDMRTIMDWNEQGFELLEDAINGKDALEKISTWNPDIIIADLGMPVMDGIEMLKQLKQMNFRGKIIILTCHDEFYNVRDAMKLGAFEYLLKHMISAEELSNVLLKVVGEIEERKVEDSEIQMLRQMKSISLAELKKKSLNRFLKGYYKTEEALKKHVEEFNLDFKPGSFVICCIYIDNYHEVIQKTENFDSEFLVSSVCSAMEDAIQPYAAVLCAEVESGTLCSVFSFDSRKGFFVINNEVYNAVRKASNQIATSFGIGLTIGISGVCSILEDIPHFYKQSKLTAEGRFYFGKGRIIHFSEVEKFNSPFTRNFKELELRVRNAVITQTEMVETVINSICSDFENNSVSMEAARNTLLEVVSTLKRLQIEFSIQANDVFGSLVSPYNNVFSLETLEDIRQWLIYISRTLSSSLKGRYSGPVHRQEITKAREYIENNYSRDITLDDICSYVNLSRTYFSQLFKKEIGRNFVEYLAEYRLEKAKILISGTDLKIVDIGCMVGITNYRYFTTLFKKTTGLTPVEFRNLHISDRIPENNELTLKK